MNYTIGAAVITKNHQNFIVDCVESLLNQTRKIDHIVIHDDASSDKTLEIISKYSHLKNVTILSNSVSVGPGQASNNALNRVGTDFVIYTSGDDISFPNRVDHQYNFLLENQFSCVISSVDLLISNDHVGAHDLPKFYHTNMLGDELWSELFWRQNFLNASAACFRRRTNFNSLFKADLLYLQDYELWLSLARDNTIISDDTKVLNYRILSDSLSQRVNRKETNEKIDMETEHFSILFNQLSIFSKPQLESLFKDFISKFKIQTKNRSLVEIPKQYLIMFLLLSHNNPAIIERARLTLLQSGKFEDFMSLIRTHLRVADSVLL
jgi:glycosyltransferase involved in cell wall biosynthesis